MRQALLKVTSFGRTWRDDYQHLRYIARQGAEGPLGELDLQEARAVRERSRSRSVRLMLTLPRGQEEEAYQAMRDFLALRFNYFITALHDQGGQNPHAHIWLPSNPVRTFQAKRDLEQELRQYLAERGIRYPDTGQAKGPRRTPQELHIAERQPLWLDEVRKNVQGALEGARDWQDWVRRLREQGVEVVRVTDRNITLGYQGRKVRLGRLFKHMRSRSDVERILAHTALRQDLLATFEDPRQGVAWVRDVVAVRRGGHVVFQRAGAALAMTLQELWQLAPAGLRELLASTAPRPLAEVLDMWLWTLRTRRVRRIRIPVGPDPGPTPKPGL